MAEKSNEFALESNTLKSEIQPGSSVESIVNSENRKANWNTQCMFVSALDLINHALIMLVTIYIVYHSAKKHYVTNIHVILCTIGYVLLMSEAILVLAGDNVLSRYLSRRANKHLHWILQAIGLIFNLIGVGLMYDAKRNYTHFNSIHAITGLASLVIVCVVTIFGYPVWIAWKLRKFVRPVTVKLAHNFLGIAGFVIGMVSQCYGYKKNWLYYMTEVEHSDLVALVLTALITVLSLRSALISFGRQVVGALN